MLGIFKNINYKTIKKVIFLILLTSTFGCYNKFLEAKAVMAVMIQLMEKLEQMERTAKVAG
jgi:hypothetical protein